MAAWLLALQAASGGGAARPALFDPFAVFCAHGGSPAGRESPPPALPHRDACCLAACAMAAIPPAVAEAVPVAPALPAAVPEPWGAVERPDGRRPTSSATIRGPPGDR